MINTEENAAQRERERIERIHKRYGIAAMVGVVTIILAALTWFIVLPGLTPKPIDVLTYERSVADDQGLPLDHPNKIISKGTMDISLAELCSPAQLHRYSSDGVTERGFGLKVTFITHQGTKTTTNVVELPAWRQLGGENNPARRATTKKFCVESFGKARDDFVAQVPRTCAFGLTLDITNGMDENYRRRSDEIIQKYHNLLNGRTCSAGGMQFNRLTAIASQGNRWQVLKGAGFDALFGQAQKWMVDSTKEEDKSSLLGGLSGALGDFSTFSSGADVATLDVFTDGLENTPSHSAYATKGALFDQTNWSALDATWQPASLKLKGVVINLHPFWNENDTEKGYTDKAFVYLADRLTKAGAQVNVLKT